MPREDCHVPEDEDSVGARYYSLGVRMHARGGRRGMALYTVDTGSHVLAARYGAATVRAGTTLKVSHRLCVLARQ